MAATTAPASQPSSQQPPPPTAEAVLRQASRDPSAAAAHLPELPPDALADILSSLSAASLADHLALLPLSPSPSAASAALAALLSAPTWPSATLLAVASLLRDLPPAYRSRVPAFLGKILSLLPGADAQDLPAIAYQLLLLASKPLHPRAVLAGLLRFFGGRRGARVRAPPSIARQVEGTVLLNFAFVVKQDPVLTREVLAAVKADAAGALSGFAVAVLLSVARVRRFNEGAVGVLRDAAAVSRRDYRMSRRCKWLPDCMEEELARGTQCVEKGLLKAVDESIAGREHVLPSIVQVGFLLLEVLDGDRTEEAGLGEGAMGTEEIGITMLSSLFEIHEMARTEIIEQCKFRILSAKPQQSAPVLRLLGCLIRGHPFPILEYIAHLKELLDYFSFMNDKISTGLISCILPLTKFSRDLKDYIILVVRKAMFKKEDMVRIAATNAIVELIIAESRRNEANSFEDSSSQPSSSQQPETRLEFGRGLFQELSGLLRRCLSQQTSVKEVLYEGLIRIATSDPAIAGNVLDFLWPHFLNYYTEDGECPLKISLCFKLENAKLCLVEPLDSLLSCISRILQIQQNSKCERPHDAYKCFGFAASQDIEVVTELILDISRKLHLEQRHLLGNWATDLCRKKTMQSPSMAREVVKLAIHLTAAPDDMILVCEIAAELKKLMTSEKDNSRDSSDTFHIVNCKTKSSLAAVCLQMVELSLTELDWGLGKLKAMLILGYSSANIDEDQPADERTQRLALEEALYSRSTLVVHALSSFAHMSLKDTQSDHFLKLTAKFYKLLTRMSKSQIAPKGYTQSIPSLKFQKLAEVTSRMLTSPLYDFVSSVQENQETPRKVNLAKIRRESKCIPDLIYQIEDYEKYLIQLSKLTKVNLLRHAKRSVARDFWIEDKSGEQQQEEDHTAANAVPSDDEPDEDAGGSNSPGEPYADENASESEHDEDAGGLKAPVEANADENTRSSIPCGSPTQESESDEEEEMLAQRKRAKTKQIVQDSDEEVEDE
ncbi:Fanconi anemia group I protein homolog isoform X2 [Panicum virgatum]|uniref:Fanconi anemia group I protein homolog isoform X2 n=1 Tax=Panicum virgatum TaxID=38727 RepID=UPI0019D50ACA|nr:Fanconi anemia group I protein homolog isoform X2 [Panicum virgatum]